MADVDQPVVRTGGESKILYKNDSILKTQLSQKKEMLNLHGDKRTSQG